MIILYYTYKRMMPILAGMCLAVVLWMPVEGRAQTSADPVSTHEITKTINDTTTQSVEQKRAIIEESARKILQESTKIESVSTQLSVWKKDFGRAMAPYYSEFMDILSERVLSRFGMEQVIMKLDEITHQMASSHQTVENVSTEGDSNPFARTVSAGDAKIYEILTTTFCNPNALVSPDSCRNRQLTSNSNEDFIAMFLGERTWANNTIIDALLVARRFFAPVQTRAQRGVHSTESSFIGTRVAMAQANLRMAILNSLAARRAPTSTASNDTLEFMFRILANSTPFVSTVDASVACSPENLTYGENDADELKSIKFMSGYVCSFTSAPISGTGERLISEAAIDRIIQHDFYLSGDFYGMINSQETPAETMDKMEVFMKAQQVAQDYRQLRLLQMKVAATAMNIMNQ